MSLHTLYRYFPTREAMFDAVGERAFAASPGDYVALPHGVPHTFRVIGDEPAVTGQPVIGPPMCAEEAAAVATVTG